jgi:hypothetical protein
MASIAYIADKKMIEFHRLNGNHTMNFWRLSSQRKFSRFFNGDYLFFLAKGTEKPDTREKGIVGYGKLEYTKTMTLTQMWKEYDQLNGFSTKNEFKEAVQKIAKTKTIPKSMQSLYLKEIIFFEYPIYLSEIGITISNSLESYTYLDRYGVSATVKLLKEAEKVGIDSWQVALDEDINQGIFELDLKSHIISDYVNHAFYQQKAPNKILKNFLELKKNENFEYIKGSKNAVLNQQDEELYIGFETTERKKEENFFAMLGRVYSIQRNISMTKDVDINNYRITIVTEYRLDHDQLSLLKTLKVSVIFIDV